MRKLVLASLSLAIFSIAIVLFQSSCQKEASAGDLSTEIVQKNKIFYKANVNGQKEIWTASYDGSNKTKFNITFPAGFHPTEWTISPDGQTLIIHAEAYINGSYIGNIFTCNTDGSNLKKIIEGTEIGMDNNCLIAY